MGLVRQRRLWTIHHGVWAWVLIDTARRERSPALVADARHIFSDVITFDRCGGRAASWRFAHGLDGARSASGTHTWRSPILWQGLWKLVNESPIQGLIGPRQPSPMVTRGIETYPF